MAILIEIKKEVISLPVGQRQLDRINYGPLADVVADNDKGVNINIKINTEKERYILKEIRSGSGETVQYLVREDDHGIFNDLMGITNIDIEKFGNQKMLYGKMEAIEAIIGMLKGRGFLAGPQVGFFDKQGRNIKRLLYKNDIIKLKKWLDEVEREFYKI